jgi:RNA polymerase-binding transcription factor DksA
MESNLDYICNELRETRTELLAYLKTEHSNERILQYIKAELNDIESALLKIDSGDYGKCEITGQYLPAEMLQKMPTAKSAEELLQLEKYCRKPLYS